jgi:REase_DpnII-MboI
MRLSRALCTVVGNVLPGSHATLEELFVSAGAPGSPPQLSHHNKWKEWLFRSGQDPEVDSLAVLGTVLEEFMDLPPTGDAKEVAEWAENRGRVEAELEKCELRYYPGGRVLPQFEQPPGTAKPSPLNRAKLSTIPEKVDEVLEIIVGGLRRAMHPLIHRRKGLQTLSFNNEHDVQDLLHALLRPWVNDIRAEEFTPSYAGSSTRMDFLLPKHRLVIETKIVRDRSHARKIGDELIIDIEHYRKHPDCRILWCVIYDPEHLLTNSNGLVGDLRGDRSSKDGSIEVRVFVH